MVIKKQTLKFNPKDFSAKTIISDIVVSKNKNIDYFKTLLFRASNLFNITIINKTSFQYFNRQTKETIVFYIKK